jgi:hypothetical protein
MGTLIGLLSSHMIWADDTMEMLSHSVFKINPTVATNQVSVVVPGYKKTGLTVTDITGKKLFQQFLHHTTAVDISFLSPGIYYFRLESAQYSQVFEIIRQTE